MAIDPSARIAKGASVAADVTIGPFCIIDENVTIGSGARLIGHVCVTGHTTIGDGTTIYPFTSLGTPPQSVNYRGGPTRLTIGARCEIREHVTMNTGTEDGGGYTSVGDDCLFMVGSHVGHDCHVGSNVTLANGTMLGGHVEVGDYCFFGGGVKVHQYTRIGEGVMVAGGAGIGADVVPFGFVYGYRGIIAGLNVVGMKRRGYTRSDLRRVRQVYDELLDGEGAFKDRVSRISTQYADDPLIGRLVTFIRSGANRPLMKSGKDSKIDSDAGP
jgi:UDP-N-acetylglucosamine acyltransferase